MPIPERTTEAVRNESEIADLLQHNWVRWGGGLWAAAFVKEFAGGLPFAHLDIAGPAFNSGSPWGHVPSGGTGFAVATLVDWLEQLA
jgi:leucyl aminopeptidase